ncbi:unnamed protein product [Symbiodinium sp. CCMP2592]|nr:unnamed protein product [Symbiodinium sp. CCMP2592]
MNLVFPRRGGGDLRLPERLGLRATPVRLWSFEKGSVSAGVGFDCLRDVASSLLYANLICSEGEEPGTTDATMSAIRTLLDLAEACSTCKIIIGLSPEHASCEGLACSLLRLGFQVISVRKCPLLNDAAFGALNPGFESPGSWGPAELRQAVRDARSEIIGWQPMGPVPQVHNCDETLPLHLFQCRARSLAIGIGLYVVELSAKMSFIGDVDHDCIPYRLHTRVLRL